MPLTRARTLPMTPDRQHLTVVHIRNMTVPLSSLFFACFSHRGPSWQTRKRGGRGCAAKWPGRVRLYLDLGKRGQSELRRKEGKGCSWCMECVVGERRRLPVGCPKPRAAFLPSFKTLILSSVYQSAASPAGRGEVGMSKPKLRSEAKRRRSDSELQGVAN